MKRSHFSSKKGQGSALLGILIILATFCMVVAALLSSANQNSRITRDQLENEAAYTAALSGIHTGRALLNYPTLLISMLNRASLGEDVTSLLNPENVTKTLDGLSGMVADVMNGDLGGLTAGVDPLTGGLLSRHGLGNALHRLSDGRIVLIDVPLVNGKVMGFANDTASTAPRQNLFSCASPNGFDAYVDRLRITTVPLKNLTGIVTLKDVALIIEARGIVDQSGRRKERIVQERVLIYPDITKLPIASAGAALLSGGGLKAKGNANFNVAWGSVLAKGNIELTPGLTFVPSLLGKSKLVANDGFRGAGIPIPGMSDLGIPMTEKWLRWQSGKEGDLKISEQSLKLPLVGEVLAGLLGGSNASSDLFSDIKNGNLVNSLLGTLNLSKFELAGKYTGSLSSGQSSGLYQNDAAGKAQNGALIQHSESVDESVDLFLKKTMDYTTWKDRAIKRNRYVRPLANQQAGLPTFGNSFGQGLYLTRGGSFTTEAADNIPLTSLNQLSMRDEIAGASGYVHRTDSQRVDDSFLFVDYTTGSNENPGALVEHFLGDSFMFKGILYICGNVKLGDAGSNPPVFAKSPDQYAADPESVSRGQAISNVVVDGILYSKGTVTSVGNAVIYGTLGVNNALESDKSPTVFYNVTNSLGRLQLPVKSDVKAQVVLGRLYEVNSWAN